MTLSKNQQINKQYQFWLYTDNQTKVSVNVRIEDGNIWLNQRSISELFETTPQNITMHLRNIFDTDELDESSTCKEFLQVQKEGDREINRTLKFYNLDTIIALGYRINSQKATSFRIWVTKNLKEFILNGAVFDKEREKMNLNLKSSITNGKNSL